MRWMRDIAVVAGLAAVGLGFTGAREEQRSQDALLAKVADQCRTLEQMIKYRAATKAGELNVRGWPISVDALWFEHAPPINPLLDDGVHPWIEIAAADEEGLTNPPVRMAIDPEMAQFWYNPYQGVVRARVPVMVSDDLAVDTYNQINGTNLATIFDQEHIPSATPASAPAKSDASSASESPRAKAAKRKRDAIVVRVNHTPATDVPTPR